MAGQNVAKLGLGVNDSGSIIAVAHGLSQHYGVKVCVGSVLRPGTDFSVTPPVIHLPMYTELTPAAAVLVRAFIDHEVAHVRFTDKRVLAPLLKPLKRAHTIPCRSFLTLLNILEDVRVERCMCRFFPGSRENLRRGVEAVFEELPPDALEPNHIYHTLYYYMLWYVRSKDVPSLCPSVEATREKILPLFGELLQKIEPLLDRVDNCQSTQNCFDLATEIYAQLLVYACKDNNVSTEEAARVVEYIDSDALESSLRWLGTNLSKSTGCAPDVVRKLDLAVTDPSLDIGKNFCSALYGASLGCVSTAYDLSHEGAVPFHKRMSIPADKVQHIFRCSAQLRARLQALLQADRMQYGAATRYGVRVSTKKLACASIAPDVKPFLRKAPDKGGLTQVLALLDLSGSMATNRRDLLAVTTMYALAHACCMRNVQFGCDAFSDNSLYSLIEFSDRPPSRMYSIEPKGGTPLFTAGTVALGRFNPYAERRILILFSDGEANDRYIYDDFLSLARRTGVELYGVGMGYDRMQDALPDVPVCTVMNMDEFPGAMFNLLERALIRR